MQRPSDRLKRKVEKENLWLFVLSVLAKRDANGADIKTAVTKKFGFLTGNVTVYKVLYLLERGGYVTSQRNGREVVYTITSSGKGQLREAKKFLLKTSRV